MKKNQGFSLTEVVVSLCLMMSMSYALLKQQWQIRQLFTQTSGHAAVLQVLENTSERMRQHGFGLTEVLIALLLASMTTTALMHQYLATKQQYLAIQKALDQQVELQLVSELIRDSVRRAGFTPCSSVAYLKSDASNPLHDVVISNDLTFYRMNEQFETVLEILNSTSLLTTTLYNMREVKTVLIADCKHAEVQRVVGIQKGWTTQTILLEKPLIFSYEAPIYIGEWIKERFYIHPNEQDKPSLFYDASHAEELTPYVNSLKANVVEYKDRLLLDVVLGFEEGKPLLLQTMLRMR